MRHVEHLVRSVFRRSVALGLAASLGLLAFCNAPSAVADATATQASPPSNASTPASMSFANLDPDDDYVVAPPAVRTGCEDELKAAKVRFAAAKLPVHTVGKKRKLTCGADQVVTYFGSAAKITYEPSPLVTCTMALALARFEAILQEEAMKQFGKPVVRIRQLGTYACREMANYPGWVSEHSYANAIDLEAFVLKDGTEVTVLKHFERTADAPTKKAGLMLLGSARRAYDENVFSTVLTPYFDALHKNHFHLDLSRYRNDGTRPGI